MNETMGNTIMRLRKERRLTQEQLANELGISYQAVSKWETGNSCPDIATLPLLAALFGVSIDALFGLDAPAEEEPELCAGEPGPKAEEAVCREPAPAAASLPWPDDDGFYAVLYHGHELIGSQAQEPLALRAQQSFRFQYEGPAQNVNSVFDLEIEGGIGGSACAGGDLHCGDVGGDAEADGDLSCGSVGGSACAGGDLSCDRVGGNVTAGGDVSCDDVDGSVSAGGDVSCDDVGGSVFAGGDLSADSVGGASSVGDGCEKDGAAARLGREIGNMASWGAELGRRIAETVEKNLGKKGSFYKSWPAGEIRIDLDDESEDEK